MTGRCPPQPRSPPLRVLLIDDSTEYRGEFADLLAAGSFADAVLDLVADPAEGLRVMNCAEHDIYFVDYRLPGDNGTELIRCARAAGNERPIVCLTGFDSPRLDLEAEQAGASGYLCKGSFSAQILGRTIRFALRNAACPQMPRDTESRFRLAQETANIGTWDWDVAAGEMLWDPRMYQLYGCEPSEGGAARDGQPAADIWRHAMQPEAGAALELAARASLASGEPFQSDFEVTWDDGSVHHLRIAGRVTGPTHRRPARLTGITWDVTELRRLVVDLAQARDAAERANLAKSRFLAAVSHELRTPLHGILGYARMMRLEGTLSGSQEARIDAMLGAGQHLLEMINGVLDLSEIEAEHVTLHNVELVPREVASGCLELLRPAAAAKSLRLSLEIDPAAPERITADATRLRQILLNLLGNAVKFTASGAVELRLEAAGDGCLRLAVADTGPGIPPDRSDRLFQDFERLGDDGTGMIEGAGLGLALSARLAAMMGGGVGHIPRPGGGSVFWLELPAVPTGGEASPKPQSTSFPAASTGRHFRVLVADDTAMNRDIVAAFLRAAGHVVVCAESGEAAVTAASAADFDVVLMDVRMPGVDGLEATRRIRALAGRRGRVPVVALTASAFAGQTEECRGAGMSGHLTKPFTQAALLDAVAGAAAGAILDTVTPDEPGFGFDLPLLDEAAFSRTAAFLSAATLRSHLLILAERSDALAGRLRGSAEFAADDAESVTAVAHALSGSASLFGFERLSATARAFEHATQAQLPAAGEITASFIATAVLSAHEMRRRIDAPAVSA